MTALCYPGATAKYYSNVGHNFNHFADKLDQIDALCDAITAASLIAYLFLSAKANASPVMKNITAAIGGACVITTGLLAIFKAEGVITGRTCFAVEDAAKQAPVVYKKFGCFMTFQKKRNVTIALGISSVVSKMAGTVLMLTALGAFPLSAATQKWLTTTLIVSTSALFVFMLLETITDKKIDPKTQKDITWDNRQIAKLIGRVLLILAIPGAFRLISPTAPLALKVSILGIAAIAFAYDFLQPCFGKPEREHEFPTPA